LKWCSDGFSIEVLYSLPGVATQVVASIGGVLDILIDCGDGVLRDLLMGYYLDAELFNRIAAVLISHEHFDHVGGLYSLMDFMHMIGRVERLIVAVPRPSIVVKGFIRAVEEWRGGLSYGVDLIEVVDGDVLHIDPVEVRAFEVVHRSRTRMEPHGRRVPAVGYSLSYGGVRVVYSGDTGPCPSLEREVEGADLAILEATWGRGEVLGDSHLTEDEAIRLGEKARHYILIHRRSRLMEILEELEREGRRA